MPSIPSLCINSLIRCDCVHPRTKPSTRFKPIPLDINLQERCLENIFCHLGTAQVSPQVTVKLPFVTPHQQRKHAQESGDARRRSERTAARTQENGKLPEDIPPADNDSALEAQIRKAAIEETDPELKKRLWDEYRQYKGLPVPN